MNPKEFVHKHCILSLTTLHSRSVPLKDVTSETFSHSYFLHLRFPAPVKHLVYNLVKHQIEP